MQVSVLRYHLLKLMVYSLLITGVLVSQPAGIIAANKTQHQEWMNQNGIEMNVTDFVVNIIDLLENEVIYEGSNLVGWPLDIESAYNPDLIVFRGYQLGTAGIGDFFLDAYLAGWSKAYLMLNDTINHFVTSYDEDPNGGIHWSRIANARSDAWTGNRYGISGILDFLVRAQSEDIIDVTKLVEDGLIWLQNQRFEDGSIPIEPESYVTTGQEYGAAGIGSSFLKISDWVGNDTYTDFSIDIGEWIIDKGNWKNSRFRVPWTPFGEDTEFDDFYTTGYGVGEAGVLAFMIDLYERTDDSQFKDVAIGLANELVGTDLGGYWISGSVDYITELYDGNGGLGGLYVGASGIALQLLRMYQLTNNQQYLESAVRVERFIESLIHVDGSVAVGLSRDQNQTGLALGSSGIAKYYLELFTILGDEKYLEIAEKILTHVYELFLVYGNVPIVNLHILKMN
ncbi:MAG: hypothetical protein ACXAB7_00900 [Candidatus Kariarchaeaceae archaeon]|jgi:rhamnogalacturonyl hydrolase YesR